MKIEVTDIIDNDDGSCLVTFDMDYDTMKIFAEIGIKKVLFDAANKAIEENSQKINSED